MKKVQFISLHLGFGGIQKSIINQANYLSQFYEVELIVFYKLKNEASFDIFKNVKVIYLSDLEPNKTRILDALKRFSIRETVKELITAADILYKRKFYMSNFLKNNDADVLISTRLIYHPLVAKYGSKKQLKIAQEHREHSKNIFYISKLVLSMRNFDYLLPVSQKMVDFYKKIIKYKKLNIEYLPNGFEPLSFKGPSKNNNLVTIGRLHKIKAFDTLIKIFNEITIEFPTLKLTIVGDGPEYKNIKTLIGKLKLENSINLVGSKSPKEIEKILHNSSIFVMASREESFGISLLEAMSAGLPSVFFSSANGFVEVASDTNSSFIIENRNKSKFIDSVNILLKNKDLRHQMGINARARSLDFKNDTIINKLHEIIKEGEYNDS